jgi:RNA polymerase sigma-70 factor (ECF subfamily)
MHDDLYTEIAILARIAEGDEMAFTLFFKAISPAMSMLVKKVVKEDEAVREVLQEFFIRLWLHRDKLPEVAYVKAYVKKMALNECFTYLNRQALLQQRQTAITDAATASSNETENTLSYRETQHIIATAIRAMPAQRRQIYEMSRQQGLNAVEIAATLHISPSYVRNTISAALQFIREQLKQSGKIQ